MRRALAIVGTSAALLGGCGGSDGGPTNEKPSKQTATSPARTPENPKISVYRGPANIPKDVLKVMARNPRLKALNDFRARIYEERRAKVLLGACATWPNRMGGFTAVVNPGDAIFRTTQGKKASFLIFTHYDLSSGDWQPMNGPTTVFDPKGRVVGDDENLAIEIDKKGGRLSLQDIALTDQPTVDEEGRPFFKDQRTGSPVMLTGFAPAADYSQENIQKSCVALREHKPLPGVLSTA